MSLLRFDFEGSVKIFENPLRELVARDLSEVLPIMKAAEEAQKSGKYVAGFVSYEAAPAFRSNLKTITSCREHATYLVWCIRQLHDCTYRKLRHCTTFF